MRNKNEFASAGYDAHIKIWNKKSGKCIQTIEQAHETVTRKLLYSEREQLLLSLSNDATIKAWEI